MKPNSPIHARSKRDVRRVAAVLFTTLVIASGLRAQTPSTPTPAATTDSTPAPVTTTTTATTATTANGEKITTLEKYTVSDVPIENQILPTVRPIDSVYGDDRAIIDIPRSVSSVNKAWMDDREVKDSTDFGQFAPGVYSEALYGIPGVPQIRGDEAQIYVGGQLMPFSRNSIPLSFNGVEALDIVKGPGTAVYGPQGNGPGGYVNFVPKDPYFDGDHADISATFGYLTSGHSYSNPQYTLDFGGPITDKLAYRVSYLGRYGTEYYLNTHNETQDVYIAFTYLFSKVLKFEWWTQGFATRTTEVSGPNRPTQNFIWKGDYIGGPTEIATTGPLAYYGYDVYLPTDGNPATNYPSGADGAYVIVNPATAYHVKLPDYEGFVSPSDTARSKMFQSQLKTTITFTPELSLVNLDYYALGHSNKVDDYGYDEFVPRSLSLQNRTELHAIVNFGPVVNNILAGPDLRYTYVRSYDDFTSSPTTVYDLYKAISDPSLLFYPGYYLESETFGSGYQIPGEQGYSAGEFQDTTIDDWAGFIQDDVKFTSKLSAILGFREDAIHANTANPPLEQVGQNVGSGAPYPLPYLTYNGYYSVTPTYLDRGALYSTSASVDDPSYFASIVYKFTETQSIYITYDRVDAILGVTNFGGVTGGAGGPATVKQNLKVGSTLYETGYKGSFLGNTLYFGSALYQQLKTENQLKGPPFRVKTNGLELDAVYQPTKNLSINANFTYQNATAFGTSFFEDTGSYLDDYATTTPVDGTFGTGIGGPNYGAYQGYGYYPPNGRMRAPGVPAVMANGFLSYKLPYGFGVGIGPNFIGHQFANDEDTLHFPSECQLDGYITYAPNKRYDVRLNVTNLLDARLMDPIDVSFEGNDSEFVRPPISASITLRMHY
jgi:outer membrane receptor protein involved in Fe transport